MAESSADRGVEAVVVGIDVAEERKGLDLVALDRNRRVVASAGRLTVEDVTRMVLYELRPTLVCVDSPSGWSRSGKSRAAERELRKLGITAFATGADPGTHPFYRWMRIGFAIYESLSPSYDLFRGEMGVATVTEVFPEASAVLLAGRLRDADETKQAFRRQVLRNYGVDEQVLPTIDRVDAALAALTGVLALEGTLTGVGDPGEGVILVPVFQLPSEPLTRLHGASGASESRAPDRPLGDHERECLCGCGAPVRRRFLPGHDAKLKSRLLRARATGDELAADRLAELGWLP